MFKLKQYMPRKALQALYFSLKHAHLFLWITRLGFHTSVLSEKIVYIAKQSSKTDRWWPL